MPDPKDIKILDKTGQWQSLKGPKGDEGKEGKVGPPINMLPSVPEEKDRPTDTPPGTLHKGDGVIVQKTGDLWVWDGHGWIKSSHLKGDPGKPGPAGRSAHTFDTADPGKPPQSSKPADPATEPDKAHIGDIWFVPGP